MLPPIQEPFVSRTASLRLATFAAVAVAMMLSGCGRKGALDPPPGGWDIPASPTMRTSVSTNRAQPAAVEYDADGRPIAPAGPNRRLPGDALLD
jgi:predicted small lipoprotein YifL